MEAGALWRHSLVTGQLTPRVLALSKKFSLDSSVAYTAGLLHDIGKIVIGQVLDSVTQTQVHKLVEEEHMTLLQAEKVVLGCDHAQVGGCLLHQWRIPEIIVEAVEFHHQPPADFGTKLSPVVHIADAIAHQAGASPGWGSMAICIEQSVIMEMNLTSANVETLNFAAFDAQYKAAS